MATEQGATAWWNREAERHPIQTGLEELTELDERTFDAFHARTSRPLWAYLRRLSICPQTAEDLHQEAYIRYLNHPCPSSEPAQQRAYLFRIATNLLRDRWRREERERGWFERMLEPKSTAPSRSIHLEVDFDRLLRRMKPRQRALLWLAHVEEYTHQEIAQILDLSPPSVKVLLWRARRRMARLLEESGWPHANLPASRSDGHEV